MTWKNRFLPINVAMLSAICSMSFSICFFVHAETVSDIVQGSAENADRDDTEEVIESGAGSSDRDDTEEVIESEAGSSDRDDTEEVIESEAEGTVNIDNELSYYVVMPENVKNNERYPAIYLMPYDGYSSKKYEEAGFVKAARRASSSGDALEMVLVFLQFAEGQDYDEMLSDIVSEVEEEYPVIPDTSLRGVFGANIGGYMAMENALVYGSDMFFAVGSSMGDFTSGDNIWKDKGSVLQAALELDNTRDKGYSELKKHFFYIDGPNLEAKTTEEGGTTDIGAAIEKRTNPYWQFGDSYYLYSTPDVKMCEYAVLDGRSDDTFMVNSFCSALNRFSSRFTENLFSAEIDAYPQAVTSTDETINISVIFSYTKEIENYSDDTVPLTITSSLIDPESSLVLSSQKQTMEDLFAGDSVSAEFLFSPSDLSNGLKTTLSVSAQFLGFSNTLGTLPLIRVQDTGTEQEEMLVDLMGDWYFHAYKKYTPSDTSIVELDSIDDITPSVYETWGIVQPALGWWTADFDESLGGSASYNGYAWYIRTFDMPEDFPEKDLILAMGYFDEANEVYINGSLVGYLGMNYDIADGIGVYDGSNQWDVNCVYDLDPSILNYGTSNTIAVRICNSSGEGGWYEGPVGIYSKEAYESATQEETRFTVESYDSPSTGTEQSYRLYLPEDYEQDNDARYPAMVLLHGINSTSKAFEIDKLDKVLDKAIAEGAIKPMIVVLPDDPTKTSFWLGTYEKMVTSDLTTAIKERYNVSYDPRRWMIAGTSMGGAGSYNIGTGHPEVFRGIISFYGALNYVQAEEKTEKMSEDELKQFSIYLACGNQDMYNFYEPQENVSRILTSKGVEHYHYVNCGTHSTDFYLPLFVPAVQYLQQQMGIM